MMMLTLSGHDLRLNYCGPSALMDLILGGGSVLDDLVDKVSLIWEGL